MLLLLVAVFSLVFGTVRWTVWRIRVDQAVEARLAENQRPHIRSSFDVESIGPVRSVPAYDPFESLGQDEISYLHSQPQHVLDSLLQIVKQDHDNKRRIRALRTLRRMFGNTAFLTQKRQA